MKEWVTPEWKVIECEDLEWGISLSIVSERYPWVTVDASHWDVHEWEILWVQVLHWVSLEQEIPWVENLTVIIGIRVRAFLSEKSHTNRYHSEKSWVNCPPLIGTTVRNPLSGKSYTEWLSSVKYLEYKIPLWDKNPDWKIDKSYLFEWKIPE